MSGRSVFCDTSQVLSKANPIGSFFAMENSYKDWPDNAQKLEQPTLSFLMEYLACDMHLTAMDLSPWESVVSLACQTSECDEFHVLALTQC